MMDDAGIFTALKSVSNCNVVGKAFTWFGSCDKVLGSVTTDSGGGVNAL